MRPDCRSLPDCRELYQKAMQSGWQAAPFWQVPLQYIGFPAPRHVCFPAVQQAGNAGYHIAQLDLQ